MRRSGFSTLLDPFHHKFGRLMGCLLYIPALTAEVFWSASILNALGATLKVILDIDLTLSIIISAGIALLYTLMGGLYSVAYTDVVQLICIFIGLWVGVPFAMTHEASRSITNNTEWIGQVDTPYIGSYIDFYLLLIFGGIPWQVYWQRALSARTVSVAKGLSFVGGFGCIIMAIPAALFGAIAYTADWSQTAYGNATLLSVDASLTLPLVYFHMTPVAVSFIGLGAVSAAVMSSTDSSILSASTMFAVNVFSVIHESIWKIKPTDTVVVWVMRGAQLVIAVMACAMAISVSSIYYLFLLCSDFVYVVLFPQLICVLYIRWSNSYGSLAGFIIGLTFRILGGEPGLSLPPTIEYPWMDPVSGQQFPFRTLSMLISVICILVFSALARLLFLRHILPPSADVFRCFRDTQGACPDGVVNTAYVPEAKLVRYSATTAM
ncbi:high affinity choline transporter 1-like isoform X2 [Littorina saxatilis]